MRPLFRPSLFLTALAVPLLMAGTAAAQDGGVSTLGSGDFFIGVQRDPGANLSDFDVARFFNKARCDCDETVFVYVALTNAGFAKRTSVDRSGNLEFWVGSDCANTSLRDQRCFRLASPTLAAFLNEGRASMETNARVLSTYTAAGGVVDGGTSTGGNFTPNPTCTFPEGVQSYSQTIFVLLNNSQGVPQSLASRQIYIDLTPPPQQDPALLTATGGQQAVTLTWPGVDSAVITDVLGYQVLCNRGGELKVFSDGTFEPGFQTCFKNLTPTSGVQGLDPFYTCSPLLAPTSRSYRVKILQNDITYGVAVVAIDRSGNPSTPDILYATATKTKSFYDVYRNDADRDQVGAATGGLCTLGARTTSRGAAAGLGVGLALAAIVIARRRRGRR
jgi:hypothetical protein